MKKIKDGSLIDFNRYKEYFDNLKNILPSEKLVELARTLKTFENKNNEISVILNNITEPLISLGYEINHFTEKYSSLSSIKISNFLNLKYSVNEIQGYFDKKLKKDNRKIIIRKAIQAHFEENYILSIPVFLAQIDGLFFEIHCNDVEKVKGFSSICEKCMGKLCKRCAKNNERQKPTIRNIIQHLTKIEGGLTDDTVLLCVIEDIFGEFRNDILHGRNINYANKELSARLIIILMGMTENISR